MNTALLQQMGLGGLDAGLLVISVIVLAVLVVVLLILLILQIKKVTRLSERLSRFTAGKDGSSLEEDIAKLFEDVAAIEKVHEEKYLKLLNNIEGKAVFSRDGDAVWQCRNCGHVHIGKQAPDVCPVCNHPQAYFELKKDNY